MKKHFGVLFNRKSGKIIKIIEGQSSALLKLFAMQGNVSSTRDYVVFDEEGTIHFYCEGKKNDMPTIQKDMEGSHIDTIASGLLETLI